ncbi:MAG: hypothetical protein HYV07_11000 [Deltaproteobacteria bacterium]|nr:hypothetical protein [Deltaproteobacteria bacterium]
MSTERSTVPASSEERARITRRPARLALQDLLLLGVAAGCTDTLSKASPPDQLVIYAVIQGAAVERVGIIGDEAANLYLSEGVAVRTWSLPIGSLIDEAGEPVPAGDLSVVAATSPGGCQRCINPASLSTKILLRGESCPPPKFAVERAYDRSGEIPVDRPLGDLIRIQRTGDCACQVPPGNADRRALELRPLFEGGWPISQAVTSSATLAVFHEHQSRVRRNGVVSVRNQELRGQVTAAARTRAGGYVVATTKRDEPGTSELELLDSELRSVRLLGVSNAVSSLIVDRRSGTMVKSVKQSRGYSIEICPDPDVEMGACTPALPPDVNSLGDARLVSLDDGGLAVAKEKVLVFFDSVPAPGPLEFAQQVAGARGTARDSLGRVVQWRADEWPEPSGSSVRGDAVAYTRDTVFGCATTRGPEGTKHELLSRPRGLDSNEPWRTLPSSGGECSRMTAVADGVVVVTPPGLVTCTSEGCGEPTLLPRGLEGARVHGDPRGDLFLWAESTMFVRHLGDETSFERVFGAGAGSAIEALLERDGEWTAVTASGHRLELDAEGTLTSSTVLGTEGGRVLAAAWGSDGSLRLLHAGAEISTIFRAGHGELEVVATLPEPLHIATAYAADRFLLAGERKIHRLVGSSAVEVEVEWDDPDTAQVEPPLERYKIWSVTAAMGAVIVTGTNGLMLRLDPFSNPPVARRISTSRLDPLLFDPATGSDIIIGSSHLDCADVGAVGAPGESLGTAEVGRVWYIRPGAPSASFPAALENSSSIEGSQTDSGVLQFLVGAKSQLTAIFEDSAHRIGAPGRFRISNVTIEAARQSSDGSVMIGTTGGLLFFSGP